LYNLFGFHAFYKALIFLNLCDRELRCLFDDVLDVASASTKLALYTMVRFFTLTRSTDPEREYMLGPGTYEHPLIVRQPGVEEVCNDFRKTLNVRILEVRSCLIEGLFR
jgi:hypothetical protein